MINYPPLLNIGDTIGIFSPSTPAAAIYKKKYLHGLNELRHSGFNVLEGSLTGNRSTQGYRSGTPAERAQEFMDLYLNPEVHALMAVLGGSCSSSLIPYLDFEAIRQRPKAVIGFSDVTALQLALLHYANLSSFYGPMVIRTYGEWPKAHPFSQAAFFEATMLSSNSLRELAAPSSWSSHKGSWDDNDWNLEPKPYIKNNGWNVLRAGKAQGFCLVANLNTLVRAAGTEYFPDLRGKILIIEEMRAPLSDFERNLRHLERLGIFNKISGLIVSKFEYSSLEEAPFTHDDLILEIINTTTHQFPVITEFDCGHTTPMLTLTQMSLIKISAEYYSAPVITVGIN